LISTAVLSTACLVASLAKADTRYGDEYLVATVNPLASDAGAAVLAQGGNAVDAAVTAALTLAVVDGHNSGIGGGCLILIHTADGKLVAIDGREQAPAAATRDMFVLDGQLDPKASQVGPLAVGVPGALAAYGKALEQCGTVSLARTLEPAIENAREGFVINESLGRSLQQHAPVLSRFEGSRGVYFKPNGKIHHHGDRLVQTDLANTLQQISENGLKAFYAGEFASKVGDWMQQNGGLVTADDLASYRAIVREPIESTFRGRTIVGFPPPSSGGVHVAQALNLLENFDLKAIHNESPNQAIHIVAEAFNRVFADRAYWLGDSDFAKVPRQLTNKEYAKQLASSIDLDRATSVKQHGTPPLWNQDLFGRHTTHIAAADSAGNWVAITATVNTSFGSKVIVPGTGVVLNNEMDDFSIQAGVPNAFGLVGAANNAVEAGKRPLSSMSPTIVLDANRQPVLTLGAAGGPKIITQVILGIIRHFEYGQPLADAIANSRFHHQWRPNQLGLESTMPRSTARALVKLGHEAHTLPSGGVTQAIARTDDGKLVGVSDPRIPGKVAGN